MIGGEHLVTKKPRVQRVFVWEGENTADLHVWLMRHLDINQHRAEWMAQVVGDGPGKFVLEVYVAKSDRTQYLYQGDAIGLEYDGSGIYTIHADTLANQYIEVTP